MVKKFLLGFFLFLFVFPLISAPPSTPTIINFDQGYEIVVAPEGFLKQYEDYQLNFFVYNISNGTVEGITSSKIIVLTGGEINLPVGN